MEWTTEKPTKDGWYWVFHPWKCGNSDYSTVEMIYIYVNDNTGDITYQLNAGGYECEPMYEIFEFTHFIGPIEPPKKPE